MVAVVLSSVVVLVWGGPWRDRPAAVASPSVAGQRSPAVYVVQPGDTFWAIVQRLQPESDPRPVVDRLVRANGGPLLRAGQRVVLPDGLTAR
ncbi:MAG: LysM peptidoglycan-binding domain-containing protein [Acidimicrobiales bacterium]